MRLFATKNTQRIQSERTLRSYLLVSAGRSKQADTRLRTVHSPNTRDPGLVRKLAFGTSLDIT